MLLQPNLIYRQLTVQPIPELVPLFLCRHFELVCHRNLHMLQQKYAYCTRLFDRLLPRSGLTMMMSPVIELLLEQATMAEFTDGHALLTSLIRVLLYLSSAVRSLKSFREEMFEPANDQSSTIIRTVGSARWT